jgi:hypothetical protein
MSDFHNHYVDMAGKDVADHDARYIIDGGLRDNYGLTFHPLWQAITDDIEKIGVLIEEDSSIEEWITYAALLLYQEDYDCEALQGAIIDATEEIYATTDALVAADVLFHAIKGALEKESK